MSITCPYRSPTSLCRNFVTLLYNVASVEGGLGSFGHSAQLSEGFATTFRAEVSSTNSCPVLFRSSGDSSDSFCSDLTKKPGTQNFICYTFLPPFGLILDFLKKKTTA